jgi:hypothetical protein
LPQELQKQLFNFSVVAELIQIRSKPLASKDIFPGGAATIPAANSLNSLSATIFAAYDPQGPP